MGGHEVAETELTARQIRLADRLLRARQPVTVAALASALDVSTRTLQRDLPHVQRWLAGNGVRLSARPRTGLRVVATAHQVERALAQLAALQQRPGLSPEERQERLRQELLVIRSAKLLYFARRFGVTEATVSHDLDRIEPWFAERGLTLLRKPGYGIELQGPERCFRGAIIDLLRERLTDERLIEGLRQLTEPMGSNLTETASALLLRFVDRETVVRVEAAVRALNSRLPQPMADGAAAGLVVHLALAMERLRSGGAIHFPAETLEALKRTREWAFASELAGHIAADMGLQIPEEEVGYITMHLRGARLWLAPGPRPPGEPGDPGDPERQEAMVLAHTMAATAEGLLGVPLAGEETLIRSLAVHLVPAIHRLRMGLEIRNPLLQRIRTEYPELFEASRQVCALMAGYLGVVVPDAEVGYVAMHLGAALERIRIRQEARYRAVLTCPSGVGSSQMLAGRVAVMLPEVEVVAVTSFTELPDLLARLPEPPDLVISTVSLDLAEPPVVLVSPLLDRADVEAIRRVLDQLPQRQGRPVGRNEERWPRAESARPRSLKPLMAARRAAAMGQVIVDLLRDFRLRPLERGDPVASACGLLAGAGLLADRGRLESDLRRREALGRTEVAPGLWLLHARTAAVTRPVLGLLRTPGEAYLVMLAPVEASPEALEALGVVSSALVESLELVDALRHRSEEYVREAIGEVLTPLLFLPPDPTQSDAESER